MARLTLLEIVQKVLSSVEGDEVNSITDTVEARQIAEIAEDVFNNMITNQTIPEVEKLIKLDGLSDTDYPNYLSIPVRVTEITDIKYNKATLTSTSLQYREVKYLHPTAFLNMLNTRDSTASNVETVSEKGSGVSLLIYNDKHPTYWTSFDDRYLVFDSYDSTIDSTLQSSKTVCMAKVLPQFSKEDTYIPDIDDKLFPILLNEVKSWAFVEQKQATHVKAEQDGRKQKTLYQSQRHKSGDANKHGRPDYGR